jgi:hypothetical protein
MTKFGFSSPGLCGSFMSEWSSAFSVSVMDEKAAPHQAHPKTAESQQSRVAQRLVLSASAALSCAVIGAG